jgi:hypothetical protein
MGAPQTPKDAELGLNCPNTAKLHNKIEEGTIRTLVPTLSKCLTS